jgi:hypothetical protein
MIGKRNEMGRRIAGARGRRGTRRIQASSSCELPHSSNFMNLHFDPLRIAFSLERSLFLGKEKEKE